MARAALAGVDDAGATQLISESMQVPMDAAEREALIAALKRLGESSKLAQLARRRPQGLADALGRRRHEGVGRAWIRSRSRRRPRPTPTP